ncbi:armadillo-type protein [Lobosporangium transversale]|uniref:Armadillo-type protein n=1 Tax=Lobosporangium transversale TaxID=64571 RepID=A0A1Y2GZ46_9FUNG|nr:armadillo-type protein [Lobosporangium transversale]ORZ27064.1 armadillo-type protein [Lobosporangium transversale]|eukprot:XP_021884811.1 armadillo-type protein [Lobosporangium transversale]
MMAASLDLHSLEQYCETLYNPSSQTSRIQVESLLNYHFPTFSLSTSTAATSSAAATGPDDESLMKGHSPSINTPIESALFCRSLLENTKNPYALMFATSRLKNLVEDHFTTFTTPEQLGLRTFVLRYIYQNPDAQPFIITAQAQLFALITKLGWLENDEFRALVDQIQVFFQPGRALIFHTIGMRLLAAVATEMNIPSSRHATKFRKIAVDFRDKQLLPIFQFAISMLQSSLQISDPDADKFRESILVLMRTCLSFDFIGTLPDESSDDVGSIQTPTTWRSVFEESGYLDILWECWKKFSGSNSVLAMESLSQAASIRRSLFSNDDHRNIYIYHIMREIAFTLKSGIGQNKLQEVGNFHEFCRMLSKFRSTFQLSEMSEYKEFDQWISTVGEFTTRGFHSWKWSPNSVPYLLTFWSKMISSLSSVKQATQDHIQRITVDLSRAYLKSRLECAQAAIDGEVDDPMESEEELVATLEMYATLARSKYVDSGRYVLAEFKDLSKKHRDLIQTASAGTNSPSFGSSDLKEQLQVVEMQLTWMVYMIGALVGGRISYQSTSEQDEMDGELSSEVLGFVYQQQVWSSQRPLYIASADAHLYVQSAILYFYTQFRSSYIGEEASKSVKLYALLGERWGLNIPNQVLDVIMSSSLGNLRSSGDPGWKKQEDQLVVRTLRLYTHLASGYSAVKHIRKLETTQALLKNHNSSDFKFLDPTRKSSDTAVARCRLNYYMMLSRVLFSEDNVEADFWQFVHPWEVTLDQVTLAFEGSSELSEEDIRLILLGIFKDLRGFVSSITNRKQYALFFQWFYPAYTPIVLRAIEIWPHNELSIAILRFWNEFASNKSSRVTFDSSSPNGILLFRETSNILYTYGQNLLSRPLSDSNAKWAEKYKGIMLYFSVTSASLSGKYVNFGVFKLYGDKALDQVLEMFFSLMLAIPVEDMISFPKLSYAYFNLIDVFTADHMTGLSMMPQPVLEYMFRALGEIIVPQDPNTLVCTLACSAIDKICTFVLNWILRDKVRKEKDEELLNHESPDTNRARAGSGNNSQRNSVELTRGPPNSNGSRSISMRRQQQQHQETHWLVDYLMTNKEILNYLFMIIFQAVTFENRSNYWSLSRPLLGLILLNREFYVAYTNMFVESQLPDRQEQVQTAVKALLEGIVYDLTTVNRDRFTQNITTFRREVGQLTLMSVSPVGEDNGMN